MLPDPSVCVCARSFPLFRNSEIETVQKTDHKLSSKADRMQSVLYDLVTHATHFRLFLCFSDRFGLTRALLPSSQF